MLRPLVAVPAYVLRPGRVSGWEDASSGVPHAYLAALLRAGVRPAVLAPIDDGAAAEVLAPFAGVVLVGGGDVDPSCYGAARHRLAYGVDPTRDRFELALAAAAIDAGVALLAICRGMQVLNVALGGTLVQHLPDRAGLLAHGRPEADGAPAEHPVVAEPGSRLAGATGACVVEACVSVHHQALDRLGDGLLVTGTAPDGVVEAVEADRGGWVLAIQWHPERSAARDPQQQAIFDAFATAVRDR